MSYLKKIDTAIRLTYPEMYKELKEDINNLIHSKYKEPKYKESQEIIEVVRKEVRKDG